MTSPDGSTDHYVSREDGSVYYTKLGQGDPLVFLHSIGLSGWSWRKVIGAFAQHFTCYNVDLPGFDHSDIPPRQYSVEDYTQAILDVLDSGGIAQTSIVGNHTGAIVAVELAGRFPHRVRRLVLDGLPYWNRERGLAYFEKNFIPQYTATTSYGIPVLPLLTVEEAMARAPSPIPNRDLWEKRIEIRSKSRLWMRLSQESNTNFDMEVASAKVKAPTLLIYNERDLQAFGGDRAKKGIAGALFKLLQGAQAEPHEDKPEKFTRLALDFLLENR